ncbi:F-actin-capping protein subunit alpha [Rhodotorula kratochvilovae]
MADIDVPAALSAASAFLLQSPPGELNDVYADLRALVAPLLPGGEAELEAALRPALKRYAEEQLTVVDLPGAEGGKALITPASAVEGEEERHVEPRGGRTFQWDAVAATASDPFPLSPTPDPETASLRSALDGLLHKYTANHYASGVSAVFALPDPAYPAPAAEEEEKGASAEEEEVADVAAATADAATEALPTDSVESANGEEAATPAAAVEGEAAGEGEDTEMEVATQAAEPAAGEEAPKEATDEQEAAPAQEEGEKPVEEAAPKQARPSRLFALYLVGNKYNPSNYWTGRWRSTYQLDHVKGTLEGTAQINIHYYEQGNVQLSTTLKTSTSLSPSPSAEAVVAAVKASESSFQRQLGETYATLSDASFKGLRRALPKTRSKIDWDKAGSYKLGQQIGGAQ